MLWPWAVIRSELIGLSDILYANLVITLAVAGATSIKSAWEYLTCSIWPVRSKTTFWPVANSIELGWIICVAASLINALTSKFCLFNSLANLIDSVAAILPVIHNMIFILKLSRLIFYD